VITAILFLFAGIMFLFSSSLQLFMGNYSIGIINLFVALIFAFDAYIYRKPYLGLDEMKLIVNNGIVKKETLFKDVDLVDWQNKKIIITYKKDSAPKRVKILLSQLKEHDREQFLDDLKSKLGARFA
jgi:hypothetical protein